MRKTKCAYHTDWGNALKNYSFQSLVPEFHDSVKIGAGTLKPKPDRSLYRRQQLQIRRYLCVCVCVFLWVFFSNKHLVSCVPWCLPDLCVLCSDLEVLQLDKSKDKTGDQELSLNDQRTNIHLEPYFPLPARTARCPQMTQQTNRQTDNDSTPGCSSTDRQTVSGVRLH